MKYQITVSWRIFGYHRVEVDNIEEARKEAIKNQMPNILCTNCEENIELDCEPDSFKIESIEELPSTYSL